MTKATLSREEALKVAQKYVKGNIFKHMLAVEAAMQALAKHFNQDEHTWGIVGLLHDIDYQVVDDPMKEHCGPKTEEILAKETSLSPELIKAIRSHNERQNIDRDSLLAKTLFAVDGLTGIIVSTALVHDKDLSKVSVQSVLNKLDDKSFSKAVSRENIKTCETELNLPLEKFIAITLNSMQKISAALGL